MPKLYEYFGLIVMYYANEREPVHVHGKAHGCEPLAEIIVLNGLISEVRYGSIAGRLPLTPNEMRFLKKWSRHVLKILLPSGLTFSSCTVSSSPIASPGG